MIISIPRLIQFFLLFTIYLLCSEFGGSSPAGTVDSLNIFSDSQVFQRCAWRRYESTSVVKEIGPCKVNTYKESGKNVLAVTSVGSRPLVMFKADIMSSGNIRERESSLLLSISIDEADPSEVWICFMREGVFDNLCLLEER